jgi:hypothetical protein
MNSAIRPARAGRPRSASAFMAIGWEPRGQSGVMHLNRSLRAGTTLRQSRLFTSSPWTKRMVGPSPTSPYLILPVDRSTVAVAGRAAEPDRFFRGAFLSTAILALCTIPGFADGGVRYLQSAT